MDGIWRTLAAPIIASIVGGIVVGLILGRIQAVETPVVAAKLSWIDLPNPLFGAELGKVREFEKLIEAQWGKTEIDRLLPTMIYEPNFRILRLKIENNSNLRSKEIELSIETGKGGLLARQSDQSFPPFSKQIKIKPLNPGDYANIYGVLESWLSFQRPPLLGIHDTKKVDIIHHVLSDEFYVALKFFDDHPMLVLLGFALLAGTAVFLLIGIPLSIAVTLSPKLKLTLTSKQEIQKMRKFLAYVRKHDPKKLGSIRAPISE